MARTSRRKKSAFKQQLVVRTIEFLMKTMFLVRYTLRYKNTPMLPSSAVIAIYHEDILPISIAYAGPQTVGLASGNHFGHAIAMLFKTMGSPCVLGSSSKDGNQAVFELIQLVKTNHRAVIAADGPRGPRRELKPGVMMIAAKSKAPVYLLRVKGKGVRLNTWDKFFYPLPFASLEIIAHHYDTSTPDPETGKRKSIKQMTTEAEKIMNEMI